jgi:hypothetical protein
MPSNMPRFRVECQYFLSEQGCRRGNECTFAHVYRNHCHKHAQGLHCPHRDNCYYPHAEAHDVLCRHFAAGHCRHGAQCRYAHVVPASHRRRTSRTATSSDVTYNGAEAEAQAEAQAEEFSHDLLDHDIEVLQVMYPKMMVTHV